MSLPDVRSAMITRFGSISGVVVPSDPYPMQIEDKTILMWPRIEDSVPISRGKTPGSVAVRGSDIMQVEYHRRVPYEYLGSTMGDLTSMVETIRNLVWLEHANGRFDNTVFGIERVSLTHLGALGWNEWTFGIRMEVAFIHDTVVTA